MILEIILINDIYIVAFFLCPYYLKWCEGEVGALNQEGGGVFICLWGGHGHLLHTCGDYYKEYGTFE